MKNRRFTLFHWGLLLGLGLCLVATYFLSPFGKTHEFMESYGWGYTIAHSLSLAFCFSSAISLQRIAWAPSKPGGLHLDAGIAFVLMLAVVLTTLVNLNELNKTRVNLETLENGAAKLKRLDKRQRALANIGRLMGKEIPVGDAESEDKRNTIFALIIEEGRRSLKRNYWIFYGWLLFLLGYLGVCAVSKLREG